MKASKTVMTYWLKKRNFGDRLTPLLLKAYGVSAQHAPPKLANLVCVGSVLDRISLSFAGTVLGTGFMYRDTCNPLPKANVLLLRGPLTGANTHRAHVVPFGDPGLLIRDVFSAPCTGEYRLGIVPHYVDQQDVRVLMLRKRFRSTCLVVDVGWPVEKVVNGIASCEFVISSSLHGIIAAHSLGIPAGWIELGNSVLGDGFKFHDYFQSIGGIGNKRCLSGHENLGMIANWCEFPRIEIEQAQSRVRDAFHRFGDSLMI